MLLTRILVFLTSALLLNYQGLRAIDQPPDIIGTKTVRDWVRLAAKEGDEGEEARAVLNCFLETKKEAIDAIGTCLKDKHEGTRVSAAKFFKLAGPKAARAIPMLQQALSDDKSAWVRQNSALALDAIGPNDPEVDASLIRAMQEDKEPDVRNAIVGIVRDWEQGRPGVLKALKVALEDRDLGVRRNAAHALVRHASAEHATQAILGRVKREEPTKLSGFAQALGETKRDGVPFLVRALSDDDKNIRATAAVGLGYLTQCDSIGKLLVREQRSLILRLLDDKETVVRLHAAEALRFISVRDDQDIAEALIRGLNDDDKKVRYECLLTLDTNNMNSPLLFTNAVRLLKRDPSEAVRSEAALLLRKSKENQPALIDALKNDASLLVRKSAADSLGEIGPDAIDAAPVLEKLLEDDDKQLREISAKSLRKIRKQSRN
jgi:HEAT repeat protein